MTSDDEWRKATACGNPTQAKLLIEELIQTAREETARADRAEARLAEALSRVAAVNERLETALDNLVGAIERWKGGT